MRRFVFVLVLAAAFAGRSACAGQPVSRAMTGWFNVTTEEGWKGKRYMDGERIFAEEFDSNGNGRLDVWRFYRRGILSSEERDINNDGKVDLLTRWDGQSGFMVAILRDTNQRGINDLEVELTGNRRWEVRDDRNLDGVTDRILYLNAPNDLFDRLGIDLTVANDLGSLVPREYWREMHSDDGFTGSITDYFRYSRGNLAQHGEWDGRRIVWRKVPPDYIPAPVTTPVRPDADGRRLPAQLPDPRDRLDINGDPSTPPYIAPARQPAERPATTVPDPFDWSAGGGDVDPYAGVAPPRGGTGGFVGGDVYDDRSYGGGYDAGVVVPDPPVVTPGMPGSLREPAQGAGTVARQQPRQPQPARDAPSYRGLPPGESSARSVPARMRPPGTSAPSRRRPGGL